MEREKVYVYEYYVVGFINTVNQVEKEEVREYVVKDGSATYSPMIVVTFIDEFRESQWWRRTRLKIVVVDDDDTRFRKVVETARDVIENGGSVDDIVEAAEEVFGADENSYILKHHEIEGYARQSLVYMLVP